MLGALTVRVGGHGSCVNGVDLSFVGPLNRALKESVEDP